VDDLDDEESGAASGPPLTPEEIDAARDRLAKWQSVGAFGGDGKALRARCAPPDFFLQSRLKFLHDAYVLGKFADKVGADEVCLAPKNETWPDGFVRLGDRMHKVEVTSTHGDRKLGEEYRRASGWRSDPVENWVARADSIPNYLEKAISDKVNRYGAACNACWLVVYLNIDEWGIRQLQIEQVIAEAISRYRTRFENLTVLWKGKLYSASEPPCGQR
jgi:hypothetical protein